QGGLGVCIIVASAALGTIATMVTRSAPGFLLGLFVEAGTVVAALAVRPRAGRLLFPVPRLSSLEGALIRGVLRDQSGASYTVLAPRGTPPPFPPARAADGPGRGRGPVPTTSPAGRSGVPRA